MENCGKDGRKSVRILILMMLASGVLVFLGLVTAPRLQAQGDPVQPRTHGVGYATCVYCPSPQYTDEALRFRFRGTVTLRVAVQADGYATRIEVVKDPGFGLAARAIDAVNAWRFKPATDPQGRAVVTFIPVEVNFQPPDRRATPK